MIEGVPDIEESLDRIRRQWESEDGFWFVVVAGNDTFARDALRTAVRSAVLQGEGEVLVRRLEPTAMEETVEELLASIQASGALHWLIIEIDREARETGETAIGRFFEAMDEQRETLFARGRGGVVVEVSEKLKPILRARAPKLYGLRAFGVEPRREPSWDETPGSSPTIELEDESFPADSVPDLARIDRIPEVDDRTRTTLVAGQREIRNLLATERFGEATTALEETLDLLEELRARAPDDPWLTTAWFEARTQQGRIALDAGALSEASTRFAEALDIAQNEPTSSRRPHRLRTAHDWSAVVAGESGNVESALTHASAALDIARRDASDTPNDRESQRTLAIAHNKQGDALVAAGRRRQARAAYRASLAIRKQLLLHDPAHPILQRDLSICHDKLGDLAALNGDLDDAERNYRRSLDLRRTLAKEHDARGHVKARRDLAAVHVRLGNLSSRAGDPATARRRLREATDLLRGLHTENPTHAAIHGELVGVLGALGELAQARGDHGKALVYLDASLEQAGALASAELGSIRRVTLLAGAHGRLADLLWVMEDFTESEAHLRSALDLHSRLTKLRPDGPSIAEALARAHRRMEAADQAFGRHESAHRHHRAADDADRRAKHLRRARQDGP